MKCEITCNCNECENLIINEPIVFVETRGLDEHRETLVGVKCGKYGQIAETPKKLKESDQLDSIIYIKPFGE